MKQSERIRYCKEYMAHPLRKEYEKKRSRICRNKPILVHVINFGYIFFFIMFIVYGWIFFSDRPVFLIPDTLFLDLLLLLAFGIGNIILGLLYLMESFDWKKELIEDHNSEALNKLNKEYGIFRMTEEDLYKYKCSEWDDYRETTVCSVTKKPLSISEYRWCECPGNCQYCRTFITGLYGVDVMNHLDRDDYFKR